jgi:hypothetical protein
MHSPNSDDKHNHKNKLQVVLNDIPRAALAHKIDNSTTNADWNRSEDKQFAKLGGLFGSFISTLLKVTQEEAVDIHKGCASAAVAYGRQSRNNLYT